MIHQPRWMARLIVAVEWGFSLGVILAVLVWLFVLPVLGVRCWMGHE
jgi:hypothetical protein